MPSGVKNLCFGEQSFLYIFNWFPRLCLCQVAQTLKTQHPTQMGAVGIILGFFGFFFSLVLRLIVDIIGIIISPAAYLYYYKTCKQSSGKKGRKNFKSIFITGASSGIGAQTARHFSAPGITLHLVSFHENPSLSLPNLSPSKQKRKAGRNEKRLNGVKEDCEKNGGKVYIYVSNVTDEKQMKECLLKADDLAPLDLVFANAGINFSTARSKNFVPCLKQMMDINVIGVFNTIFPLIQRMKERGKGNNSCARAVLGKHFHAFCVAPTQVI